MEVSIQYLINCALGNTGSPAFAAANGDGTTFDGCFGGSAYGAYSHMVSKGFVDASCLAYVAKNEQCDPLNVCQQNLNMPLYFSSQYAANPALAPKCSDCKPLSVQPKWHKASEFGFLVGEDAMQREILARGPISCCMFLPDDFMYGYTGGVYVTTQGATTEDDRCEHNIAVVGWGYDEASKLGYWTIQNSFGTVWGENGFFRIARSSSLKGGQHNLAVERFCSWVMPAY